MTKAVLCTTCTDIVSPYRDWETNRAWRWCQCAETGVRWRDGGLGLLEVTGLHGQDHLRVIGINNLFLMAALDGWRMSEQWRELHEVTCDRVGPHYLFHTDRRNCWALVVRVGESGDVFFIPYPTAREGVPA